MQFFSYIKDKWLDFVEFTDNIPEEASARKLEPKLTEKQLQRRFELVKAIHLAASLQHRNNVQTENIDERFTVNLSFKEKFLIEPELRRYSDYRGTIHTAKYGSGRMRILFSKGGHLKTQSHTKRMQIVEGMEVRHQSWFASTVTVALRDEEEEFIIVERARKQGYHMSIVITLTLLVLLSCLQVVAASQNIK